MATRKAALYGGPMDGADGDVVCNPAAPDHLQMGPTGGFVYTLKGVKGGRLVYQYDKSATRKRLQDLGVPLSLRELATDNPREAHGAMLADPAAAEGMERGAVLNARVEQYADRFELYVSDTLVEQLPRAAFTTSDGEVDRDGLRQWVESAAHALAQEATA